MQSFINLFTSAFSAPQSQQSEPLKDAQFDRIVDFPDEPGDGDSFQVVEVKSDDVAKPAAPQPVESPQSALSTAPAKPPTENKTQEEKLFPHQVLLSPPDSQLRLVATVVQSPNDITKNVLRVTAAYAKKERAKPVHLIVMLDTSGSMLSPIGRLSEYKLHPQMEELLRRAQEESRSLSDDEQARVFYTSTVLHAKEGSVINRLSVEKSTAIFVGKEHLKRFSGNLITYISYATEATITLEASPSLDETVIKNIESNGSTYTVRAVEKAVGLAKKMRDTHDSIALLMTDGVDISFVEDKSLSYLQSSPAKQLKYVREQHELPQDEDFSKLLPVGSVGLGVDYDADFLTQYGDLTGARIRGHISSNNIEEIQREALKALNNLYAISENTVTPAALLKIKVGSLERTDSLPPIPHSGEAFGATFEIPYELLGQDITVTYQGQTYQGKLPEVSGIMDDVTLAKYAQDQAQIYIDERRRFTEPKAVVKHAQKWQSRLASIYGLLPETPAFADARSALTTLVTENTNQEYLLQLASIMSNNHSGMSGDYESRGTNSSNISQQTNRSDVVIQRNKGDYMVSIPGEGDWYILNHTINFVDTSIPRLISIDANPTLRPAFTLDRLKELPFPKDIAYKEKILSSVLRALLAKIGMLLNPSHLVRRRNAAVDAYKKKYSRNAKIGGGDLSAIPVAHMAAIGAGLCPEQSLVTAHWTGELFRLMGITGRVHCYRETSYEGNAHGFVIAYVKPNEIYLLDPTEYPAAQLLNLTVKENLEQAIQNYKKRGLHGILTKVLMEFNIPIPADYAQKRTYFSKRLWDIAEKNRQMKPHFNEALQANGLICPITGKIIRHAVRFKDNFYEKEALQAFLKKCERFPGIQQLLLANPVLDASRRVQKLTMKVFKKYELHLLPEEAVQEEIVENDALMRKAEIEEAVDSHLPKMMVGGLVWSIIQSRSSEAVQAILVDPRKIATVTLSDFSKACGLSLHIVLQIIKLTLAQVVELQKKSVVNEKTVLTVAQFNIHMWQAEQYFLAWDFNAAEKELTVAESAAGHEIPAARATVFAYRGFIRLEKKDFPSADEEFKTACELDADHTLAKTGLAVLARRCRPQFNGGEILAQHDQSDSKAVEQIFLAHFYHHLECGYLARKGREAEKAAIHYTQLINLFNKDDLTEQQRTFLQKYSFQDCPSFKVYIYASRAEALLLQYQQTKENRFWQEGQADFLVAFRQNCQESLAGYPSYSRIVLLYAKICQEKGDAAQTQLYYELLIKNAAVKHSSRDAITHAISALSARGLAAYQAGSHDKAEVDWLQIFSLTTQINSLEEEMAYQKLLELYITRGQIDKLRGFLKQVTPLCQEADFNYCLTLLIKNLNNFPELEGLIFSQLESLKKLFGQDKRIAEGVYSAHLMAMTEKFEEKPLQNLARAKMINDIAFAKLEEKDYDVEQVKKLFQFAKATALPDSGALFVAMVGEISVILRAINREDKQDAASKLDAAKIAFDTVFEKTAQSRKPSVREAYLLACDKYVGYLRLKQEISPAADDQDEMFKYEEIVEKGAGDISASSLFTNGFFSKRVDASVRQFSRGMPRFGGRGV